MPVLIDTDILIDYLRGQPDAVSIIESNINLACISVLTEAELYQGVRECAERNKLEKTISAFTIIPLTLEIAEHGCIFSRDYKKSHGCGLADCMISATAELHGLTLIANHGESDVYSLKLTSTVVL